MSCHTIVYPPCPTADCPEVDTVDLSNVNLTGVGVLDAFAANVGTFRGVAGDGLYVLVNLDALNHSIIVSLDPSSSVGEATEIESGLAEIATQAETNAGLNDTAFVTPLKLAGRTASTTQAGVIRIATVLEAQNPANSTLAITPLTLDLILDEFQVTQVFSNAAARGAAVPAFDGQLGVQLDTEVVYTATGIAPGAWTQSFIQANTATTFTVSTAFNTTGGNTFDLQQDGISQFRSSLAGIEVINGATFTITSGSDLSLAAGSTLDFDATALLTVGAVAIPANSVVATSGTAGRVTNKLINTFLSTSNVQAGYVAPTGTLSRATFDESTVTLPQLAQRVAALVTDLLAVKLPSV